MSIQSPIMEDSGNFLLWNKIKDFQFDSPGTVVTFARKLASQQSWTIEFTGKVIAEYRKFIYLCCISPNGASPSQIIDEAWHLHLTYTRNYWEDFCKNTLQKELHHYPSKGGMDEKLKHDKWYKETLLLYAEAFGYTPDPEIWPQPEEELLPDLSLHKRYKDASILFTIPLLFIACSYNLPAPFSADGPEFLVLYFVLWVIVLGIIYSLFRKRNSDIESFIQTSYPGNLTPFEMAAYFNGREHAVNTSILNLVNKDILTIDDDKNFTVSNSYRLMRMQGVDRSAVNRLAAGTKISYDELVKTLFKDVNFNNQFFDRVETITKHTAKAEVTIIIWFLLIGLVRIIHGIMLNTPIGYLIGEWLVFGICLIWLAVIQPKPKSIIQKQIKSVTEENLEPGGEPDNLLPSKFALEGYSAINNLVYGGILASLFFTHSSFLETETDKQAADKDGACGGGCSGAGGGEGGGGGGGCGGGCGGCGGCGGGCGG